MKLESPHCIFFAVCGAPHCSPWLLFGYEKLFPETIQKCCNWLIPVKLDERLKILTSSQVLFSHYSKCLWSKGILEGLYNILIPQILRRFMCVCVRFPPLPTYHYRSILFESQFTAPSEGIFWKIPCHFGLLIRSVISDSVPFICLCMFHRPEIGVLLRANCKECLLNDFKSTSQKYLIWILQGKAVSV